MTLNAQTIHKPLEVSILVATEASPLGEYQTITLHPGIQVQLVDHYATPVAGFKGLQYIGSISLVSFNTSEGKQLGFFVGKQAYEDAIVAPPPLAGEQ